MADYAIALLMDSGPPMRRRLWAGISVTLNLAVLGYFKYANFFVAEAGSFLASVGVDASGWAGVVLPIGISFFTFQKITYVVDVYRGTRSALKSPVDYALYVALFPQLIAGPIVRYHEISAQLLARRETAGSFYRGINRFTWGLAKKVIIANSAAEIADAVFASSPGALSTSTAWLGVVAYTVQIYFDFSGYSDMAIGLGGLFGFRLPENFMRPYSAVSITDFWRRWHITLSNFFRDYLYIPLGGNRRSTVRTYTNLMTVFVLCGLWHGAAWTFVAWGGYHGALLVVERLAGLRGPASGWSVVSRRAVTLLLVICGWVLFRSAGLGQALDIFTAMFTPSGVQAPVEVMTAVNGRNLFFLAVGCASFFLPGGFSTYSIMDAERGPAAGALQTAAAAALMLYSVALIVSGSYNPFIYFQF